MTKKQREKYIRELAEDPDPSLGDLVGVIGWHRDEDPDAWKGGIAEIGEAIRKHRQKNMHEAKKLSPKTNSIAKAS